MSCKISIITPSFNRAYIIHETAESIFNQTYQNWEWVIVDDGSTDNSLEVIEAYAAKDDRVKIFQRDREPKGACVCRNIAVERCSGDYVMFLDTDDVLAPFCLEQRAKAVEEDTEYDFIIFPLLLFKRDINDLGLLWNIDKDEDDLMRILKGDPICQGTGPLWKKEVFEKVGMWNENLLLWQDIELHIRSLLYPVKYKKRFDLQPDTYLRISDVSISRTGYNSVHKMHSRIEVFTYACSNIVSKGLASKYRLGLRVMGLDIIIAAINAKTDTKVNQLLALVTESGVFTNEEAAKLRRYMRAIRFKLYRLPLLFNPWKMSVLALVDTPESTLMKIKLENKIKKI